MSRRDIWSVTHVPNEHYTSRKRNGAIIYSSTAAIPGNTFPSKYSNNAPPPVDT